VVVTHGTVLSLWLGSVLPDFDALAFWSDLRMPDAFAVTTSAGSVDRIPVNG
jgi:hypothetical protein